MSTNMYLYSDKNETIEFPLYQTPSLISWMATVDKNGYIPENTEYLIGEAALRPLQIYMIWAQETCSAYGWNWNESNTNDIAFHETYKHIKELKAFIEKYKETLALQIG